MGILKTLVGGIFGGEMAKPVAVPASVTPDPAKTTTQEEVKTPSQIAAEEEAKKKAALIAANAGGAQATTVGGGNADVTRKVLLGL